MLTQARLEEALARDATLRSVYRLWVRLNKLWAVRLAYEDACRCKEEHPVVAAARRCRVHVKSVYRILGKTPPKEE